jgi:hypothetical protein
MPQMIQRVVGAIARPVARLMPEHGRSGRYLYAVVAATEARRDYGRIGLDAGVVYTIAEGPIAAVVSDVPDDASPPQGRLLAAHQRVLRGLLAEASPLPACLGQVASGSEAVREFLRKRGDALFEQLRRVAGKVEMGLCVWWDVPTIDRCSVASHLGVRDGLLHAGRQTSQAHEAEPGWTVAQALHEAREGRARRAIDVLRPACCEIRKNELRDEYEVMSLSCLVARGAEQEFERAVFAAARFFDSNFHFRYGGPWPAGHFAGGPLQA